MAANHRFRVLYVCTGNTARSPLFASCTASQVSSNGHGKAFTVSSAGIEAPDGEPVRPEVQKAASTVGVDLTGHRSVRLRPEDCLEPDLILTMSWEHVAHIWSLVPESWGRCFTVKEFVHWAKRARARPPILFPDQVERMRDRVESAHAVRKRARADHGFWGGLRPQDLDLMEPDRDDIPAWENLAGAAKLLVTDVITLLRGPDASA
jgi:protein-tyrosine-phosphatase